MRPRRNVRAARPSRPPVRSSNTTGHGSSVCQTRMSAQATPIGIARARHERNHLPPITEETVRVFAAYAAAIAAMEDCSPPRGRRVQLSIDRIQWNNPLFLYVAPPVAKRRPSARMTAGPENAQRGRTPVRSAVSMARRDASVRHFRVLPSGGLSRTSQPNSRSSLRVDAEHGGVEDFTYY